MNRNKKLGKRAVMAAVMAGSLMTNLSPISAKDQGSIWKQRAYYQETKNLRMISNKTISQETVTINMNQLSEGEYNGYRVKSDGTIELIDAGKTYVITGRNIVDGIEKYKIVVKADVNLTLNNASIVFDDGAVRGCGDTYGADAKRGTTPIMIEDNKRVEMLILGENVLRCGAYSSVIGVGENAELTIDKNSTGRIKAFGREEQRNDIYISKSVEERHFETMWNQSVGIGKISELTGFPVLSKIIDPSGKIKMEGGSIEIDNVLCGVALQNAEINGGSLKIKTKAGDISNDSSIISIKESPFLLNSDSTPYTTVTNKSGKNLSLYSFNLPDQANQLVGYIDSEDENVRNYGFSGIRADDDGTVNLYLPSSVKGRIYLRAGSRGFYGNITGSGNLELKPMKSLSCQTKIKQQDHLLTVTSDVQNIARGIRYQWYQSATPGGTYTKIEGATGASYQIPEGQFGKYYKAKAEYIDDMELSYAEVMTLAFLPEEKKEEVKKEEVKKEEVKKQTKEKISKRKIKLTWKKRRGAKGYYLYRSVNGGKYKKYKTIKGNKGSYTMTEPSGKTYRFKAKPYRKKKVYKAVKVKKKEISKTIIFTFRNVSAGRQYRIQLKYGKEGKGFKKAGYKTVKKNVKASKGTIVYTVKGKTGYTYDARLIAQ